MTPADFERIEKLFHAALERPQAQRDAFLRQACEADEPLYREVSSLLAHEEDARPFLESPFHAGREREPLARGTRLGPYEIAEKIGAGGMAEVYRARDVRLGRDVAVKVLPGSDPRRLERFEREAQAVAALSHPNVLTVHDVGRYDEMPFLVTEILEGETLRGLLSRRTLTPDEAMGFALQTARGLEAAHAKRIVHRDLKPENLFLTSSGLLKILDFGLARTGSARHHSSTTAPGLLMGTVAYMSPEQTRGEPLDARSDVFSLGVILFEMLAGEHPFRGDSPAATLAAIGAEQPVDLSRLAEGVPWAAKRIVGRCLRKRREERFDSGHEVAVAIEAGARLLPAETPRVEVERPGPYPGLESFTEADAGRFFGRESEVEAVWARIRERRLLGLIGSSGVGKTSFVRAGVVASRPRGWAALVCSPGADPFRSLGQVLAPKLADDTGALRKLVRFDEPETALELVGRWRRAHTEALVVVDQFEELFTLCPPEVQAAFAALLGRLTAAADVHVLLSLRDDFLMRCHEHDPLAGVFGQLTPLGPLSREGARRSLVEPARREGFGLDEDLVEEMLGSVEGERGALPLLAFAAARLWRERDRGRKLLTRAAYERIGGVTGALAQHAEATLDRIGKEHQQTVREILRHLVTAQGTRASVERQELLSAFPDRAAAATVLEQLIEARLLTSYELPPSATETASAEHRHRIEIVHECLLREWPRLVWWHAQDEEGAKFRDQFRQAARLWSERERSVDLLWTGTAERELEVWRERHPGRLTAVEEDFARAIVHRARRRKRLRRFALVGVVVGLSLVAGVVAVSRHQEAVARRRAEAAQLLALGRLDLEEQPIASLAYAIASLELVDTPDARRFVVEALARGATAFALPSRPQAVDFSHDGRWLATAGTGFGVQLWSRDGGPPVSRASTDGVPVVHFDPLGSALAVRDEKTLRVLSIPDLQPLEKIDSQGILGMLRDSRLYTFEMGTRDGAVRVRQAGEPESRLLGRWDSEDVGWLDVSSDGASLAYARGREVFVLPIGKLDGPPVRVGEHPNPVFRVGFASGDDRLVSSDTSGGIRVWSIGSGKPALERAISSGLERPSIGQGQGPGAPVTLDVEGSTLIARQDGLNRPSEVAPRIWDLGLPLDVEARLLRYGDDKILHQLALDPSGRWLAAASDTRTVLWALDPGYGRVVGRQAPPLIEIAFTPDGKRLASFSAEGVLRLWPLSPEVDGLERTIVEGESWYPSMAVGPRGRRAVVVYKRRALLVPLDGRPPRPLERFSAAWLESPAISRDGRFAAAGTRGLAGNLVEVWDLRSGDVRVLDPRPGEDEKECGLPPYTESAVRDAEFTSDGRLLTAGHSGLRLWNLEDGTSSLLKPCTENWLYPVLLAGSPVDRYLLVETSGVQEPSLGETSGAQRTSTLTYLDLRAGVTRELRSHGDAIRSVALDCKGEIAVTGDWNGVVRVGGVNDEAPHLLYGHESEVTSVAVSPDGRWIASAAEDGTIRLWPMPEGPPLQTLPYEELLARVRSFTNLRVVRDDRAETGFRLEVGPFPGWAKLPGW